MHQTFCLDIGKLVRWKTSKLPVFQLIIVFISFVTSPENISHTLIKNMDITTALPVFFVTLREGVEAFLVIGIVMACLAKANARHLFGAVYSGIVLGILASIGIGLLLKFGFDFIGLTDWKYSVVAEQFLKGLVALIAIGLLSWMLIWMTRQAKTLKSDIEASVRSSLTASTGIFTLIFVDVLREGVETVLFVGAQSNGAGLVGAIAGIAVAVTIGLLIFRGGVRINLKLFFQVMGIVLLLIIGGLLVTALRKFEAGVFALSQIAPGFNDWCNLKDSCILGRQVWDLTGILPDREFPGILLKPLFGYTQKLYIIQAFAYTLFLISVGRIYWRSLNKQ